MPKLPADFDWSTSFEHVELLARYVRPGRITKAHGDLLPFTRRESIEEALQRLLRAGALVDATTAEAIDELYTTSDLKRVLAESGLKQTGAKRDLVDRVVAAAPPNVLQRVERERVVKCSEQGLMAVRQHQQQRVKDQEAAMEASYRALQDGNLRDALKQAFSFREKYIDPALVARLYEAEYLPRILESCPEALQHLPANELQEARLAAAMAIIWRNDRWLRPDLNWLASLPGDPVAARYIDRNARMLQEARSVLSYNRLVELHFEESDFESCDCCRALAGQTFTAHDLPQLPLRGCTSKRGCQCQFVAADGDPDEMDEDIDFSLTPYEKLEELKDLLDAGLITQHDYDEKKREILSRL